MIDKKALITRDQTEPGDTTDFLRRLKNLCESHGAGPNRWNDHQLLLISGLGSNLTAAVTWMLNHLLEGDGHLTTSIHMEAESFVEKSDEEIDLCRVFDESRFCRPRVIPSGYTLERGAFVLTPLRLHHFYRVVWGEDSEGFDPEFKIPQGIAYGLFDTICRGTGLQGSYWYMLPDDYGHPINTITTYPALFWLHGGMRRAREGFGAARLYKEAMRAGRMTQTILIMPQALPVGW
ncbi:hypothetical protein CGCSCA4_v003690 [Colletotrichum siamense]|uniref:Uncharacterized protein n=1 Tax=Colletotrichum siamense TaxID=690259 RepID=A0A9P5EZ85_COLSI|nr:hypothetical protein CGCSCA4_v003690 [Colletotrichum siamense]KAF4862402.1 hypothetical protein CGCSCA2_v003436 [Colletotrichum siamense]